MAKRLQKRRKLSVVSSAMSGTDSAGIISCSSPSVPVSDAFLFPVPENNGDLSCVSCHRALGTNTSIGTKQSHFVVCPRCRATSCTICSRTCTTIPASQPPTPLLSFSPSPPGTPLGPTEDRSLPLPSEFHLDETPRPQARAYTRTESARRRRHSDIEDDDERTVVGTEDDTFARMKGVEDSGASPGCSRVMCKNCCIENVPTGATTCYDCYGLPSPTQADRHQCALESEYSSSNPSMTSLLIS
ncbi:hypothetical protein ACEPAH_9350 [Sanghuangporus vaninii]